MAFLLADFNRAGSLDFSISPDKTGKPRDTRRGTEFGLNTGVPPSPVFNYLCFRRSAMRFCFVATACSAVLSVLQGAAANGASALVPARDGSNFPEFGSGMVLPLSRPPSAAPAPFAPPVVRPPGALSVDAQLSLLNTINTAFVGTGKVLSNLCIVVAYCKWRDLPSSKAATIVSYLFLVVPPFIMASVPWFLALDMERYFDQDPKPEHSAKFYYRLQCGTLVYGGISSAVLSIVPSLIKATTAWKSVAPEMTLWGHLFFVLPILDLMVTYPSFTMALQVAVP